MSQAAYCVAIRDAIRSALSLGADSCEVGFDGAPKPGAGQKYVGVHPGSWQATAGDDNDLDEQSSVQVTVTLRLGTTPKDRWGVAVWLKAQTGLEAISRQIIAAVHMNYQVMNAANDWIEQNTTGWSDRFHHPVEFLSGTQPQLQGPDWFTAVMPDQPGQVAEAGVSQTLTFGSARRMQGVANGLA